MPLLSVFTIKNACTNHTVTHSAGQRYPLPGGTVTGAIASLRPRRSLMASHQRETEPSGLGRSTEVVRPSPVAALAEARPFPANGARPRETMRVVRVTPPLAERHPGPRHVAKTTDTRLSLSGWCAPAETRATQQPKPRRPEPTRPITSETATFDRKVDNQRLSRRNSTCDSPKTHHASEPARFLGRLRLGSPAKVGRFAARPECLPPSTEPVSSVAAACWRSHPCGACQAGT
jgi:hypothetical protein